MTVIFWGESAGISGKIHCDLPEGYTQWVRCSTGRFTGTKRSVTTAGDSGHQFHPQAIFAQRLLESLLREAGCVFSVCRNICRQTELCLLVCICLCLSCYCCAGATRTPVIMHMHMEDCKGLRLQTVCLHFFAHYCFSSP